MNNNLQPLLHFFNDFNQKIKYEFIFLFIINISSQCCFAKEIHHKTSTRDPFKPFLLTSCKNDFEEIKKWKLKGIIGKENDYKAWIMQPNGKWHQLKTGEFILINWKINEINLHQVNIHYTFFHKVMTDFKNKEILKICQKNPAKVSLFFLK